MTRRLYSSCIGDVPGCRDCIAEAEATRPADHECDDLCRLTADMNRDPVMHLLLHQPIRCRKCRAVIDDKRGNDRTVLRSCPTGLCRVWACPGCDAEWASDGPVGCRVCTFGRRPRPARRPERLRRLHSSYGRRTRR